MHQSAVFLLHGVQGLLSTRRHVESREDPGNEVPEKRYGGYIYTSELKLTKAYEQDDNFTKFSERPKICGCGQRVVACAKTRNTGTSRNTQNNKEQQKINH